MGVVMSDVQSTGFTGTEVFMMHEMVILLDRLARVRVLDRHGVTYPEFLVALAIDELGRPSQNDVGKMLDLGKSLVSQRVSALLGKGLIEQHRVQTDRRQVELCLTKHGSAMLRQIYSELEDAGSPAFEALADRRPEFRLHLRVVLDELRRQVRAATASPDADTTNQAG